MSDRTVHRTGGASMPGHLPQGGVVRIMGLVEQGYVYIRP